MAEEEVQEAEDGEKAEGEGEEGEEPKKKKLLPKLVGLGVVVLGAAYLAFTMAVPKKIPTKLFEGPFVQQMFEDALSVNLDDSSRKRYLLVNFNCFYWTYEEAYVVERMADPLTHPLIQDAVVRITSAKSIDDVFGKASESLYLEEIRDVIEPILFPVEIGASSGSSYDLETGLRVANFVASGTFRGEHDRCVLHVDGPAKSLQLGDGEPVTYEGSELSLPVTSELGETVFIDVTRAEEEFVGDVKIGVKGRVQQMIFAQRIVQ